METATPKKQSAIGEKRGRPSVDPKIKRFIYNEDFENKMQRPEDRLPRRVLAHRIHEQLLKQYKGKKRVKIPKVSTIEKMLGRLPKEPETIDGPWSIHSLSDFPIPAEALPSVLRLSVAKRENVARDLTIREAQWIARLYSIVRDDRRLAIFSSLYARDERIAQTNPELIPDESLDLALFEAMTGQTIDSKRAAKILGHREFDVQFMQRRLFGPKWRPLPADQAGELVGIRDCLRDIGGEQT